MKIATTRLEIATDEGVSIADITGDVNAFIASRGIVRGLCVLTVGPSRSGLTLAATLDEEMEDLLRLGRRHLSATGAGLGEAAASDRADVEEPGYAPAGVLAYCLSLDIRYAVLHLGNWDAVVLIDAAGPRLNPIDVVLMGS